MTPMNLLWPSAGAVAIAAIFVFKTEIGELISRINTVGPSGVTLVDKAKQVNINISAAPSADELQKARENISTHAKHVLGMHPVTLAYLIRSATCSLWNKAEIEKIDNEKFLHEIETVGFGDLYLVDNEDTQEKFKGDGFQVVLNNKGAFLLMAFEVQAEPCTPAQGSIAVD